MKGGNNVAEVFTLDSAYLDGKREQIKNDVAYARYQVAGAWYTA